MSRHSRAIEQAGLYTRFECPRGFGVFTNLDLVRHQGPPGHRPVPRRLRRPLDLAVTNLFGAPLGCPGWAYETHDDASRGITWFTPRAGILLDHCWVVCEALRAIGVPMRCIVRRRLPGRVSYRADLEVVTIVPRWPTTPQRPWRGWRGDRDTIRRWPP